MLEEHLEYVSDALRLEYFRSAIGKTVKRGGRVADLGSGSGILGLLCAQAGAAHVHFIDDSAMIDIARETVQRAGFGDRASFIKGRSQRVDLPERVDVVICDHVGHFGFDYGIAGLFQDAKRRFLKPGGTLIPGRIKLHIAALQSEQCQLLAQAWKARDVPDEYRWLRRFSVNCKHSVNVKRDELLGAPAEMGGIDFHDDQPDFFSWTAEMRIEREGVMHGLVGWFDCELAEGAWMTNSPLAEKPIRRRQAFMPVGDPVPVRSGDLVKARVMARPDDNQIAWIAEFPATGLRRSHSTWEGMLISPVDLFMSEPNRVPRPSREGIARMSVLGYCDGRRTVREIERAILRHHADLFPSPAEISRFVAHVLGRDTV